MTDFDWIASDTLQYLQSFNFDLSLIELFKI